MTQVLWSRVRSHRLVFFDNPVNDNNYSEIIRATIVSELEESYDLDDMV